MGLGTWLTTLGIRTLDTTLHKGLEGCMNSVTALGT
jgi:hypothetical protein